MFRLVLLALCAGVLADKHHYHTYNGTELCDEEYQAYVDAGVDQFCVIEVEDCDPNEGRRLDNTCNNLHHPTRGAAHTPFLRLLKADFTDVDKIRLAKSGKPLPNMRKIRTNLCPDGRAKDEYFSNFVTAYWVATVTDFEFAQDVTNYAFSGQSCCAADTTDERCSPVEIPSDDRVHRFSGHRCLNLTTPISYQNVGCLANGTAPERIDEQTPLIDLSNIYGSVKEAQRDKLRLYKGGLLKYVEVDGAVWPPSDPTSEVCRQNVPPLETHCNDTPDVNPNGLLGVILVTVMYWRHHNYIANKLAEVNPSWDDEKLFTMARELNIAFHQHVLYYELYVSLLGKDNMIRDGVISDSDGYRDFYDENVIPQQSLEFMESLRWAHMMQEGTLNMYDEGDNFLKTFPIVNGSFRTGFLAIDDNFRKITRGMIRQPSAKGNDLVADPDLVEVGLGNLMTLSDLMVSDGMKSRLFGFQPYIKYREYCTGQEHTTWEDLTRAIPKERVELLRDHGLYEDPDDMDFMVGIWAEDHISGGYVPPTLYCIVIEQLKRNLASDRHWYEREDRPNAFTLDQLAEVRKFTIAHLLCHVSGIEKVQPHVLYLPGEGNEIGSCDEVLDPIDFEVFRDDSC